MRALPACALLLVIATGAGCGKPSEPPPLTDSAERLQAPVIPGLGPHRHTITTSSAPAQRFFNQGLVLAWAFDYRESARAFREAARLDPRCAMCEWGIAYALGPNINDPFASRAEAAEHVARARALSANATRRERAYIDALSLRYGVARDGASAGAPAQSMCGSRKPGDPDAAGDALDQAYANAMGSLARAYPDDLDAAVLHAEARMMLAAWDWWSKDRKPRSGTLETARILEHVLARDRRHPAANHFYIHLLEASAHPERALGAALRLENLVPAAGHLVHMPAHIYQRVGRYHDATRVNQAAIEADRRLALEVRAQGFEPLSHVAHHHHFLWSSAAMEGRSAVALAAAAQLGNVAAHGSAPFGHDGSNDYYRGLPLMTQVRFERWKEILAIPEPRTDSPYLAGMWQYARGTAEANSGDLAGAARRLRELDRISAEPALAKQSLKGIDTLAQFLAIAGATLRGELERAQKNFEGAIAHFTEAVRLESELEDEEPPPWLGPARHALGGALLAAGRGGEAEAVFREDLRRNPANGWALYGLARSLRLQDKDAAQVEAAARAAWQHADVPPPF